MKIDAEKLISLVQGHPELYDKCHPDYMKAKFKDEIWRRIGAELECEGAAIKMQWLKIRECYREAIRRQNKKRGQKAARIRPWMYQKQMTFLLPYMKTPSVAKLRATESAEEEEELEEPREVDLRREEDLPREVEFPSDQSIDAVGNEVERISAILPRNRLVKRPVRQFVRKCETRAKQREDTRREMLETDALYQFFRSMYSTTKQLPASYQRSIRKEIFKVVTDTEEQYDTEKIMNIEDH